MRRKRKKGFLPFYIGIDPGVEPVIAVIHREVVSTYAILKPVQVDTPKYKWQETYNKVIRLSDKILDLLSHFRGPVYIGIESVSYGSKFNAALMAKLELAIQIAVSMLENKYPARVRSIIMLPPGTWKKTTFGKGNLKKEEVYHRVRQLYPHVPEDHNHTDAVAIAMAVKKLTEEEN